MAIANFRRKHSALAACTLLLTVMGVAGCGGGGGTTAPAGPAVTPVPPPVSAPQIAAFTATPATVVAGQPVTLAWSVTGATSLSISPGPGAVTGSSVVVTPSLSADYVLTATNAGGSVTATTRVTVAPFAVTDEPIGDPAISYIQIEVSPDMRFMTWIEEGAGTGGASVAWLSGLDPVTGALRPSNGRGFRIADIPGSGSPQWGQDATGFFSITVDTDGRLLTARPILNTDGSVSATVTRLATPANRSRAYPYASRVSAGQGFALYHQDDPASAGTPQLWSVNLANPSVQTQVTQGPVAQIGQFGLPPFLVNVQRWFYDAATVGNGIPVATYGNTVANPGGLQPLTLEQLDFTTGTGVGSRVGGTSPQLFDPFPFLFEGERHVIAGLAAGPIGLVLRRDAGGLYTSEVRRIETTGSDLVSPSNFASAEPFVRNGRLFTAYQLNEPGAPGTTNGEIWLTSVLDNTVRRRISLASPSRRADPEFFIGRDKVWILYYARTQNIGRWQLRRAETGL